MFDIRHLVAAVALVMPLALVPGAAAKKPSHPLTLEVEGQPLSRGAPREATSSTFELANDGFDVHCTESSFVLGLKTNGGSKMISATVHGATFRGGGTIDPEACAPAPEWVLTWDPTSAATLDFFVRGEANLKGGKLMLIRREDVGIRHEPGCHLASKNLKVRFAIGETPQPLVFGFASRFKMEREQGPMCGETADYEREPYMYGEFAFTSGGHPVEVVA